MSDNRDVLVVDDDHVDDVFYIDYYVDTEGLLAPLQDVYFFFFFKKCFCFQNGSAEGL